MTELEDKASRRAQRREQQKTSSEGAEGTPESAAMDETKTSAAAVEESDDDGAEVSPAKGVDQIRDRNARLRAQAAEERRAKREREKAAVAVPMGLDASERMDDIFVRTTHAVATWIRGNFRWLQWVVIGGIAVGFGVQAYRYTSKSKAAKSSDALAVGLTAEGASVRPAATDGSKTDNPELELLDSRPAFDSEPARLAAAEQGYRKAIATHDKTGAGWLARLGLAGVLFDQQKWDEALEQYRAVRASELAKNDPDVLGRCLEGIGLSLEGKDDKEGALKAFQELTNQEGAPSMSTLGLFHQARIYLAQGNKEKAKELATKAKERVDKEAQAQSGKDKTEGPPRRPGFVAESVKMLLARIDPTKTQDDAEKLQHVLEGLKNQAPTPAAPTPAPGPESPGEAPSEPK